MNTLDQYNINMCNEVLQGEFVRCIFDLEQEIYQAQLHYTVPIDFDKNYDTIKLMSYKKASIISVLDEQATQKKTGTKGDKGFHSSLERLISSDKKKEGAGKRMSMKDGKGKKEFSLGGPYGYEKSSKTVPKILKEQTPGFFKLQHYAANVTYDVRNWVDKNLDRLSSDSYDTILTSQMPHYMIDVFTPLAADAAASSVARSFANSLQTLVNTLQTTDSNFVRCLKASNPLTNNVWKNALVLNQLKYTGMLDTLVIRRGGFPVRMELEDFKHQYRVLQPTIADLEGPAALAAHIKSIVPDIIAELAEKPPESQANSAIEVGTPSGTVVKPLVLMRDWLARDLDARANEIKGKSAVITQAVVRMGMARHDYGRMKSARDIQSALRAVRECKPFFARREMTLNLLPELRGLVARAISCRATQFSAGKSERSAMAEFVRDNVTLEANERSERKRAAEEDEYATRLRDAHFGERLGTMKHDCMRQAKSAFKQAMEYHTDVQDVIDTMTAKSAEVDARWSKMQNEGVVRAVPLVRKYKTSAQAVNPPSADAYKFKYSFHCKGTAEVSEE